MKKPARRTLNIILTSDYSDFVDYLNFDHGYQPDDYRGNGDVLVVTTVSKLMLPGRYHMVYLTYFFSKCYNYVMNEFNFVSFKAPRANVTRICEKGRPSVFGMTSKFKPLDAGRKVWSDKKSPQQMPLSSLAG